MSTDVQGYVLEASEVEKRFGPTHVLKKASLRIAGGEIHALLGGNGAGKSTLIRIISGSLKGDGGSIIINGSGELNRNAISVVFQDLALLPHLTVAENIYLPHRKSGFSFVQSNRGVADAAEALAVIDDTLGARALNSPVAQLDLHERQLVEIARALSSGGQILLLDEPTANLTFAESERLFGILRQLANRGISMLLVSHRMSEIRTVCDVCTILRDGKTVIDRQPVHSLTDEDIVEAMGQAGTHSARPAAPPSLEHTADARLGISGPGVQLSLRPGSVLGLAGAPAGPAALIDQLIGARRNSDWSIRIDGLQLDLSNPADAVRNGIGYVSGDRTEKGILAALPIVDNIVASARVAGRQVLTPSNEASTAIEALRRLSIKASSIFALPQTLSGGTQQKLLLARWLGRLPKVLVLEEPTRGVDIGTKREIYAIIHDAAQAGCVVVWWSTEFSELIEVCTEVIAFDLVGSVSAILSGDRMSEVALAQATGMAA